MTEVGRGCWKKVGGATPWYELTVAPTPNVGASWYNYVNSKTPLPDPTKPTAYKAVNYGVRALQGQLNRRLAAKLLVDGWLGKDTATQLTAFQQHAGQAVDGQAGPQTCRALVFDLVVSNAAKFSVPAQYVDGVIYWESGYDFGGMGSNNWDTGIAQIDIDPNVRTNITWDQAMDPEYSIQFVANGIAYAYKILKPYCDKSGANPWHVAIAYHNSPKAATDWAKAGAPVADPSRSFPIQDYVTNVLRSGKSVL